MSVFCGFELRREDLAHDPIVAGLFDDLLAQPGLEVAGNLPGRVFGFGLGQKQPAPDLGGTGGVRGALEQALDQRAALAGTRVIDKIAGLGGRRDLADQVEADAAQELSVVGDWRRADLGLGPARRECAINAGREGRGVDHGAGSSFPLAANSARSIGPDRGDHENQDDAWPDEVHGDVPLPP